MARTGRPETPIRYRFLQKIVFNENGCWNWGGAKCPQGYGFIKRKDGAQLRTHRVAYELAFGPIPKGMFVCHRCDNPSCVRPNHLFLGTQADNMADMVAKGRAARNAGEHNGSARLTTEQVERIRAAEETHDYLSKIFGVSAAAIGLIKRRERWAHL
jgi:hypothetical protein